MDISNERVPNFDDAEIQAMLDIKERTIQRLQDDLAKAQLVKLHDIF